MNPFAWFCHQIPQVCDGTEDAESRDVISLDMCESAHSSRPVSFKTCASGSEGTNDESGDHGSNVEGSTMSITPVCRSEPVSPPESLRAADSTPRGSADGVVFLIATKSRSRVTFANRLASFKSLIFSDSS